MMTYVALNGPVYLIKKLSGSRIVPPDEDLREYWTCKLAYRHCRISLPNYIQAANKTNLADKPSGGTMPWFLRYSRRALASRDSEKGLTTDTSKNSIVEEMIVIGSKGEDKTATAVSVV